MVTIWSGLSPNLIDASLRLQSQIHRTEAVDWRRARLEPVEGNGSLRLSSILFMGFAITMHVIWLVRGEKASCPRRRDPQVTTHESLNPDNVGPVAAKDHSEGTSVFSVGINAHFKRPRPYLMCDVSFVRQRKSPLRTNRFLLPDFGAGKQFAVLARLPNAGIGRL